jgi:hypothetical protein
MIRIGFGMTNISLGFGPGLNLRAIMRDIRTATGMGVMKEGIAITALAKWCITKVIIMRATVTKEITTRTIMTGTITTKTETSTKFP